MSRIQELLEKIKPFYWLIFGLVLASIFFALGRLSAILDAHNPVKVEYGGQFNSASVISAISTAVSTGQNSSGEVIGSKSGKKYYFPWCGTVKRIKPENQVHFDSIQKAREAGFLPGGNCKGLK